MIKQTQTDLPGAERRGRKDDRRKELAARVAADIRAGRLGGKLPGVTRLAVLYDSCPATMQRVLQRLAADGLVEVKPCSGTYVRSQLEVDFVSLYLRDAQPLNIPDARDNMLANYGQLYQGLYDSLKAAGVPLSFQILELGDEEQLRRLSRRNCHLVAILPTGQEGICYDRFAGCSWTRVMGAQDYNCPVTHITYDNSRIGELAARELREQGCRRFVFIGSGTHPLFRQRLDTFRSSLAMHGFAAEHVDVDVFRMGAAEIIRRLRAFAGENAEALRSHEAGLFCCADAFLVMLHQAMAPVIDPACVQIISCDNNPSFLKGVFPIPREIDICTYEIGAAAARHILTAPGSVEKTAVMPRLV
ncbi:MAG: GntR family transcriptional regulator [Lentisphaeria bacterium]|nr:GntR family transcriptional regulator [Lentisphaeria bacterium]